MCCGEPLPTGLLETLHHVGMVVWPYPRHPFAHKHVKRGRRDRDSLFQRLFCRREPTVAVRIIRIFPDHVSRHLRRGLVLPAEVEAERDLVQTNDPARAARIEFVISLESGKSFLRASRKDQNCTEYSMRLGEVWTDREGGFRLGEGAVKITSPVHDRSQK